MNDRRQHCFDCSTIIGVLCVLGALVSSPLKAEEGLSDFEELLLAEGLILTASYGASKAPDYFGFAWLVTSPIFVDEEFSTPANYTMIGTMASIGVYNIYVADQGGYDEQEVLQNNFIALNASLLLATLVNHFTDSPPARGRWLNYAVVPGEDSFFMSVSIPF